MGCTTANFECDVDAQPQHTVRITRPFEIGRYEVTQSQWESVMGANPSHFPGPDRPVEQVTWDEVQLFLEKLNEQNDGYRYRLPSEAEWEFSARAGAPSEPLRNEMAWYGEGRGGLLESPGATHPVGQKKPNAWGLYDMLGNVAEFVQDWYDAGWYRAEAARRNIAIDPTGPENGKYHIAHGGSWFSNSSYTHVWNRYETVQVLKRRDVGFRCVREPR